MGIAFSAFQNTNIPLGMQQNLANNGSNIPSATEDLHTKNFISFLWDCICILKYCQVSLSTEEQHELEEITMKIRSSKDSSSFEGRLFEFLLLIRMKYLARFFQGALLTRLNFSYTMHDYKYLQECLQKKKKNINKQELLLFNQQIRDEKIVQEQLFKRYSAESDFHLDLFQDTFFRAPSRQTLEVCGFNKNKDDFQQVFGSNSENIHNNNNSSLYNSVFYVTASAPAGAGEIESILEKPYQQSKSYQSQSFLNTICMKLTESEFYIIQKILTKNSHKIERVSQIPASWLPFERLFGQLKCVKQLKLSVPIGVSQIDLMVQFIQDNSQLEELFISMDGELSEKCIEAIRDHPSLQYLSLAISELPSHPNQLRQLTCLKEILVKPDHIDSLCGYIQPNQILLKFYAKGFKFSQNSFDLLKPYKQTFISCGNSFSAFAQSSFMSLPPSQQYAAVQTLMDFQSTNNIFLDAAISFSDTQDLKRIQMNSLQMRQDYLYLFTAKLVVELQREILVEQMKLIVYRKNIGIFQFINPLSIIADFYF